MADQDHDEPLTPAEHRVATLVAQLQEDHRELPEHLTEQVMRTARWQRAVRGTLVIAGQVVGSLGDGLALLIDQRKRPRREEG